MAYNDAGGNVIVKDMCPVMGLPGTISQHVNNSAGSTNYLLDIPWKGCKLVAAYTVVTTLIDTVAAMEIDIELNAASGTEMMSIQVAAASAVGTQDYASVSSAAACNKLDRDDADRDKVNIEVDGSTTGTGAATVHMFFEPISNP